LSRSLKLAEASFPACNLLPSARRQLPHRLASIRRILPPFNRPPPSFPAFWNYVCSATPLAGNPNRLLDTWLTLDQARHHLKHGTGRGIKVAVLDSGIEIPTPALQGLELADDLAVVSDGVQLRVVPGEGRDTFGHGTAMADIIHRLAPEAVVGSFRVLGEHLRSRTVSIREGVRQALDRGYHILNCSFGCGREDHVLQYKDWIDEAYIRDRHIVAACNNQDFTRREW